MRMLAALVVIMLALGSVGLVYEENHEEETTMIDPAKPADLAEELREIKRRLDEVERVNPLQQASAHDGTTTRLQLGTIEHPFSNPVGEEDFGIIVRDAAGTPVFMVDGGGALIPGVPSFVQDTSSAVLTHTHTSGTFSSSDWRMWNVGRLGEVLSIDLQIKAGSGITAAEAQIVTSGINGGDNVSDPIALTADNTFVDYLFHWNPGGDIDPNDIWSFTIETRIVSGAGTMSVNHPRWSVLRSAVAVDTNVTG